MAKKFQKYVNASEVGTAAFCPMALYNQVNRVPSSQYNQARITRGNIAHEELSKVVWQEQEDGRSFWLVRLVRWLWSLFKW